MIACDGGGPACVSGLPDSCKPLYKPEFSEIFRRTLRPSCGVAGNSCHSSQGAQAQLVLDDLQRAYDLLLGREGGRARVLPGDPACSLLIIRTESKDPAFSMPRGGKLSEPERCVLRQWVAAGAKR